MLEILVATVIVYVSGDVTDHCIVLPARQCSRRGGELNVTLRGDGRVDLAGYATTVVRGTIQYA